MNDFLNKITLGNCRQLLQLIPDNIINTCVTSPPYWGLRDYGTEEQIGLEKTPEEFINNMVLVFREVKRVLKDDGTLWVNIGDSYCSTAPNTMSAGLTAGGIFPGITDATAKSRKSLRPATPNGMKPKDLVGIPWMLAFALRSDGWYLRQDIIWHKPNPMPESVTDRCTKAHEYIFLLSKSPKYYYDAVAIKTIAKNPEDDLRRFAAQSWDNKNSPDELRNGLRPRKSGNLDRKSGEKRGCPVDSPSNVCSSVPWEGSLANKRSVWTVNTKPFKEAHFATFPQDLIIDCIKAGSQEHGVVLDPFMGSGTTALVASKLNRHFIGFELNPEYIKIAIKRLRDELGIFNKSVEEV